MTCWKCRKEMAKLEGFRSDTEKALQLLTPTPLLFWVCECGAREMEVVDHVAT